MRYNTNSLSRVNLLWWSFEADSLGTEILHFTAHQDASSAIIFQWREEHLEVFANYLATYTLQVLFIPKFLFIVHVRSILINAQDSKIHSAMLSYHKSYESSFSKTCVERYKASAT